MWRAIALSPGPNDWFDHPRLKGDSQVPNPGCLSCLSQDNAQMAIELADY
jgi:hypothetical protein